ncbi:MAG: HAD family phosphatase [Candidatus Omnitrophica bacterium]|nr:HAD family phosphatase [Candidatus Omnitrophota bacterium]
MISEEIKAIVFDLGNVLVDFDHTIAAKRIASFCTKTPEEIFKLFFSSDITGLFEEGKLAPEEFFLKVKEMLGLKLSYQGFVPIWNEIFYLSPQNRLVYSLANSLRADYKVALISNINILHYEYLKKHYPVFNVFYKVFTSCDLKAVKPNPLIYQKMLVELEVSAESTFYTDDRIDLVQSARELGIKSFLFRGIRELKEDLCNVGVTVN